MCACARDEVLQSPADTRRQSVADSRLIVPGVNLVRRGRVEPFLDACPTLSSVHAPWSGIALETYTAPAVSIHEHEHPEHFLHLVLSGTAKYEVNTKGRNLRFISHPGTIFLLPRGSVDEVHWRGPIHHMAVAIHPSLLTEAMDETAHEPDIELMEHWNLTDGHIAALLHEMAADLVDGSPAGTLYGESLANALAVYLLKRYASRRFRPAAFKGGLPGYRLKLVLDYIAASLESNINLSQLAAVAGMSAHYFSELFKQSTGHPPHSYVLLQRMERAKQGLRDPGRSIIDAGLEAGFQNPSHFARMFRKLEGISPSEFRAEAVLRQSLGDRSKPRVDRIGV